MLGRSPQNPYVIRVDEVLEPQIDDIREKGLAEDAVGLWSSVTIGLASTAPAFSLAATLGWLAFAVGNQSPAIILLAFVPMAFTAVAYRELNRVIPDCGTTFTWAAKAFGPRTGWMGGWGIAISGIIFMANAADIVGIYAVSFYEQVTDNADSGLADSKLLVAGIGVLFIWLMTWVNYRGIEGSARMQYVLVAIQYIALVALAGAALWAVAGGDALPGAESPSWEWINPFAVSDWTAFAEGILLAIFIYWGWDTVLAINEETVDSERTPGRAALISTVLLLGIYLLVTVALQAYAGVGETGLGNEDNIDDVFATIGQPLLGSWGGPALVLVILLSTAASMQTTIMPTARGTLAMAVYKALPERFGAVHPVYKSPSFSTVMMGIVGTAFYLLFKSISENMLQDTILSIGLAIAFYYGLTAFSAVWYFRAEALLSVRDFFVLFLMPLLGGIMLLAAFVKSAIDMWDVDYGYTVLFDVGGVFVMGMGSLLIGVVFMLIWQFLRPAYFRGETLHHDTPVLVPEPPPHL